MAPVRSGLLPAARRRAWLGAALLGSALVAACGLAAAAPAKRSARETPKETSRENDSRDEGYRFAVIGHSFVDGDEARLKQSIAASDDKSTAFVVVAGIKGAGEACSDKLYQRRRDLIDEAPKPMVVLPAGSDWTECRNTGGRTNAIERLNRVRELFFPEASTLGTHKLTLTRQSMSPRFRSYAENAHWSVGKVLYATVNLPANNNHYIMDAGRNSEYEDRLVANRFWLNRLFAIARRDKLEAVVLFSEGDLKALSQPTGLRALLRRASPGHDGFAETRRLVLALAQKFPGKVLMVDANRLEKGAHPAIEWRENVGHLSTGPGELEVDVDPTGKTFFALAVPEK